MLTVGWNIKTIDRTAMIADVISEFSNMDIYIDTLHVSSCEIFIRFSIPSEKKLQFLLGNLLVNNDILSIYPAKDESTVLSLSNYAHIVISNYGVINDFSPSAEATFNLLRHEVIGRNISTLIDWEEVKDFRCGKVSTKEIGNKITGAFISCTIRPILHNNKITGANIILGKAKNASLTHKPKSKKLSSDFDELIYASPIMADCLAAARKIAQSKYTVLIRGETGTGKELIARSIHDSSERRNNAFEAINCAAIPESLVESELFGYEYGAFSGALKGGKMGLFESANHGTVFLDEFGELSLSLQSKLLRVLQDGMIKRVGGLKTQHVNVRVIVATNQNLEHLIEQKQFREDLYYRVNILPIVIPPLRDRKEDILPLVSYFFQKYSLELDKKLTLLPSALATLTAYSWPGNVRELKNILLRTMLLADKQEIADIDIPLPRNNNLEMHTHDDSIKAMIEKQEYEIIRKHLVSLGSARKVAGQIGLSHTTVLNKIKQYHLEHLLSRNRK
ncbi:sigma-54 interaction domain-containing protein [Hafnia alvei]|uniref:sigma-54 interaction domain-containing protein n=1 Tax=Hafnia alvei TaxID=569 RepID=UPI00345CA320